MKDPKHVAGDSTAPQSGTTPGPDSEETLEFVRRAQQGDPLALSDLFARYMPRLLRVARARMGSELRGAMESMDLVQRATLVAFGKLEAFEFRNEAALQRWLVAILMNQIRDARKGIRTQGRDKGREVRMEELGIEESLPFEPPALGSSPSQSAARRELERIFDECVRGLPEKYRDIILLRDYEHAAWTVVRDDMGCPSIAAAQQIHLRARLKLARSFSRRAGLGGPGGDSLRL